MHRSFLLAAIWLFVAACGGEPQGPPNDEDETPPTCVSLTGAFPKRLDLPHPGDNGIFDPSLARDPATGRVWATLSSVQKSQRGNDHISTFLAYSDDAGATWCTRGTVVAQSVPATAPAGVVAAELAWSNEVSHLVHDPDAPQGERWKLIWHRYLLADADRRFEYGWIGLKAAASPEGLARAAERKLFTGGAYHASAAIEGYNDGVVGLPEHAHPTLPPEVRDCLVFSEPGVMARERALLLAMSCATGDPATERIVLLERPTPVGTWIYRGAFLRRADAQAIHPALTGFSAPELFEAGGRVYLVATPHVDTSYAGCVGYELNLDSGALVDTSPMDGLTDPRFSYAGQAFNGACAYHAALGATGLLHSQHATESPSFRVFATGVTP